MIVGNVASQHVEGLLEFRNKLAGMGYEIFVCFLRESLGVCNHVNFLVSEACRFHQRLSTFLSGNIYFEMGTLVLFLVPRF